MLFNNLRSSSGTVRKWKLGRVIRMNMKEEHRHGGKRIKGTV